MSRMKKILALILAVATVLCMCAGLAGCSKKGGEQGEASGEAGSYTVTVKSAGGLPLKGVAVSVFADDTLADMKGYGETNEEGVATIELNGKDNYAITLSTVPKGYEVEKSYSFNGTKADITLTSSVIKDGSLADQTLGLGDIMYDFSVTTPNGDKVTLSEMLEEKKMVLVNFWYTSCSWCVTEFPFMEEAYQMYKDDVGIIAVDPLGETDEAIAAFPASYGLNLTFPLAACPTTWANTFAVQGYPTSVIVDRYGMIVLIESGAITSLRPFNSLFETMTADDYEQKLYASVGELVTNVKPTYEMASSDEVAAIVKNGDYEVTFRAEDGESAEYSWPFIEAEKLGEKCLKASNQGIEDSFAILYADVTLKKGQAFGFDFLRSSEAVNDVMYVIVNDEDINSISGVKDPEAWERCYPVVAQEDGVYEVALCYIKDSTNNAGDDTVYVKNMRVVNESEIDAESYIPRQAAVSEDGFKFNYAEIVFNSKDGYYHVGSENGPLLLADLMNNTQFSEEDTLWNMAYNGQIVVDGEDYGPALEEYANYAMHSNLYGIVPVNQKLYELLQKADKAVGFDDADDKEWMKLCKYFQAYGTDKQLEDPIKGLAPFSAYEAKLGKNVETNYFYYNRMIMPRGLYAKFVPEKSGVYRVTSRNESRDGVDGWIFNENKEMIFDAEKVVERTFDKKGEITMVYYMEAGKPYFINIALKTTNEQIGYIYYDVEYLGASYKNFVSASPGAFSYDTDESGSTMNYTIAPGIKVVLGEDGIYYHDMGGGKKGSKLYADFVNSTSSISTPVSSKGGIKGLIELGAFDFSKDENDTFILTAMSYNDNDPEKTKEYLKKQWGEDYEAMYEMYKVDDVFKGVYHGKGEDCTEIMKKYEKQIITSGAAELQGCVVVNEELAGILQQLMDKYTFEGVETSWRKMCYYYEQLG